MLFQGDSWSRDNQGKGGIIWRDSWEGGCFKFMWEMVVVWIRVATGKGVKSVFTQSQDFEERVLSGLTKMLFL